LKPYLDQLTRSGGKLDPLSLGIAAAVALLTGLYIFYIYKRSYRGAMYNRSFNVSLVLITLVMTFIIRLITANPILSLGMMGAVSLVRFRTAIKESMDVVFILWAAAAGITLGAGPEFMFPGLICIGIIGVIIYIFNAMHPKDQTPYTLIIRHDMPSSTEVQQALHKLPPHSRILSRTVTQNGVEIILQLHMVEENPALVNSFLRIKGVFDAKLVKGAENYEQETAP
jgi:ABC-type Fe3+ transport system permease subunit